MFSLTRHKFSHCDIEGGALLQVPSLRRPAMPDTEILDDRESLTPITESGELSVAEARSMPRIVNIAF